MGTNSSVLADDVRSSGTFSDIGFLSPTERFLLGTRRYSQRRPDSYEPASLGETGNNYLSTSTTKLPDSYRREIDRL
ncbi:MAG TPA: hypothetical protein VJB06_01480 [archaeon]|nr:hypothetical protein [archaeon]